MSAATAYDSHSVANVCRKLAPVLNRSVVGRQSKVNRFRNTVLVSAQQLHDLQLSQLPLDITQAVITVLVSDDVNRQSNTHE
jgi:hypothetical protein